LFARKLFDPFHRVESNRARPKPAAPAWVWQSSKHASKRATGKVFAKNRIPQGFEVTILLKK
jgi:hypothetical protein